MNEHYIAEVPAELEDLVPAFLENRRKDLASLQKAAGVKDYSAMGRIGERMLGAGTPYGFGYVTTLGRQIRDAAERRDMPTLIVLLEQYRAYIAEVRINVLRPLPR